MHQLLRSSKSEQMVAVADPGASRRPAPSGIGGGTERNGDTQDLRVRVPPKPLGAECPSSLGTDGTVGERIWSTDV